MNIASPLPLRSTSARFQQEKPRKRFTIDGDARLEGWLAALCADARRAIGQLIPSDALEGLLLGGGYGRGEGGVLRTPEGDWAYNDLEFYVFVRGPAWLAERRYQLLLHHCGEQMSVQSGLDVEFKVTSLAKLRRSPSNMFYYDLLMGHRWIAGDDCLLQGCNHHRDARHIPPSEAARLLMNRCSGLLFAKERLLRDQFNSADADFVQRNIAKAELALGDALLTLHGQYHWSCLERNRRLKTLVEDLPWLPDLQTIHDRAVEFKLHPVQSKASQEVLFAQWERTSNLAMCVFLWLESKRFETPFGTPFAYATSRRNKCPEVPAWRALLVNARLRQWTGNLFRYPRDRVLTILPLLLWAWDQSPNLETVSVVQRQLACASSEFSELVNRYRRLWTSVN